MALPRGTSATTGFMAHLKLAIPSNLQSLLSPPLSPPGNPLLPRNLTFLNLGLFSRSAASLPSTSSHSAKACRTLSLSVPLPSCRDCLLHRRLEAEPQELDLLTMATHSLGGCSAAAVPPKPPQSYHQHTYRHSQKLTGGE